jgi:outer membrane protein assembly factor BamB
MRRAFFLGALMAFSVCLRAAAQEPVWRATLDSDVEWSQLTSLGTLLVNTGRQMSHIDTESGALYWTLETEKKLAPYNFHEIPGEGTLLIAEQVSTIPTVTHLRLIDLLSGEAVWEAGPLLAANLAVIPDPERDQLLFIGAFPGSPKAPQSGNLLLAFDLANGTEKYRTELSKFNRMPTHPTDTAGFFNPASDLSGHHPAQIRDGVAYLPYAGLMAVDLASGEVLWNQEFETVDRVYKLSNAPIQIVEDTIYMTAQAAVLAINRHSGDIRWRSKVKKSFFMPELQIAGDRVIVRVGGLFSTGKSREARKPFGVMSLDRATGAEQWSWTRGKDSVTNMVIMPDLDQVVLADRESLYRLKLSADKKPQIIEERKLAFKRSMGLADGAAATGKVVSGLLSGGLFGGLQGGVKAAAGDDRKDPLVSITPAGDDLIVSGSYHVLSFDARNNTDKWSLAFEPPGVHPMLMALSGATMALSAMGNAGLHDSWSTRNSKVESSLNSADRLGAAMSRRYAAMQNAGRLAFYLTRATEENSSATLQLMGIDLATGEVVGAVPLNDKEPVFTVDEPGRRVYYFADGREVRAFAL